MGYIIDTILGYGLLFSPVISGAFYLLSAIFWLNRKKKISITSLIVGIVFTFISILFYTSDLWWNPLR